MRSVRDALVFPFTNLVALLRIGVIPTLIVIATLGALIAFAASSIGAGALADTASLRLLGRLLLVFILGLYVSGIHRLIVRSERVQRVTLRFRRYEQAYWTVLGIFSLAYLAESYVLGKLFSLMGTDFRLPAIPDAQTQINHTNGYQEYLPLVAFAIGIVLTVALIWLHIRLSLMFPHAAVTGQISPGLSWRATAGNFWRILGAGVLLFLGMLLIYGVVGILPALLIRRLIETEDAATQGLGQLAIVPTAFLGFCLVTTIIAAFMSYAYQDLVDDAPTDAKQ